MFYKIPIGISLLAITDNMPSKTNIVHAGSSTGKWPGDVLRGVTDLIFPDRCPGCKGTMPNRSNPACVRCLPRLERVTTTIAAQALHNAGHPADDFHLVLPLWMFDKSGTVQRIHSAIKYGNEPKTGRQLGTYMANELIAPLPLDERPDLIIPIPLHRQRLLERGYNQSEQLAAGLAVTANIPLASHVLVRHRHTTTQTGFDYQQRFANVKGAFAVDARHRMQVAGMHVLLVDDVLTTGATLRAAAAPLKAADAAAISVATLALARAQGYR